MLWKFGIVDLVAIGLTRSQLIRTLLLAPSHLPPYRQQIMWPVSLNWPKPSLICSTLMRNTTFTETPLTPPAPVVTLCIGGEPASSSSAKWQQVSRPPPAPSLPHTLRTHSRLPKLSLSRNSRIFDAPNGSTQTRCSHLIMVALTASIVVQYSETN